MRPYRAARYVPQCGTLWGATGTFLYARASLFFNAEFILAPGFQSRRANAGRVPALDTRVEKGESKAQSGFEREKPLPSFAAGKVNYGFSLKSGSFSATGGK